MVKFQKNDQSQEKQIPDGAKKTNARLCQRCRYKVELSGSTPYCDYLHKTGERRNCPVGWCDKYEPRNKRKVRKDRQ